MVGKSYGQFCGLARSLDVVGDRWSLLIVRELLLGPARFGELRAGLPTIATNLLTGRLKDLEAHGVIERRLAGDVNAIVYALTPWGQQLREPVSALIRWSTPLMAAGRHNDAFEPRWLLPALSALLADRRSTSPATVILLVDDTPIQVTIADDGPHVELLDEVPADNRAVLQTTPGIALALAAHAIAPEEASALDRDYPGAREAIRAVFAY
ncbi:MAG: helix-turn-helix transcriptional regulator [Mycobacterium sp.]|nr:helix-turn-helix transcriptional regulator [Mycobacterium sp.]MBV9723325.1 helix-turn-helix transcriptional regulator [Mycobacterium sp.]